MIKPHGSDELKPLFVYNTERRHALLAEAERLPSILLNSAAAANAVMLGGGYFTPLSGYMNKADAMSVAEKMYTTDGLFWPVPIINLTDESVEAGTRIALRDPNVEGNPVLAIMDVEAVETVSKDEIATMAENIFRTLDENHPGVATFTGLGNTLLSGPIDVLSFSYFQSDFPDTFRTAVEIREEINRLRRLVLHELGHTLGLIHCHDPTCVMQVSTYVEDIDIKPASFCLHCLETVRGVTAAQ